MTSPEPTKDSTINKTISRLKALTKNISQSKIELAETMVDDIWGIVEELQKIVFKQEQHCSALIQIHSCAVSLWNIAVGMKSDGTGTLKINARLRHVSCNLLCIVNTIECTESSYKKQLVMATKTGRAWLDCDNPDMAETSLEMAEECWENLSKKLNAKTPCQEKLFMTEECERYIFRTYCYQAEVGMALSKYEDAKQHINKAKTFLGRHPKESCCLAMVCYNFGVDTFQREQYDECVEWLRESFELGKGEFSLSPEKQATTLRLLANAYLEWDHKRHWETALNAVGLANTEHLHPAGLYLKAKILLLGEISPNDQQSELLLHQGLTADIGLSMIELAIKYNKIQLAFAGLKQLTTTFQNSPDLSKIQLQHLELLIQHKQEEEGKTLIEHCIQGHNNGFPLDPGTKKTFHIIIWEKAASKCDENKYEEAVQWYNYSLSLFSPGERQSTNAGKLHRNICSCYLSMKDLDKARQSITEAENSDHGCPLNCYFEFKIALLAKNNSRAITAINKMSENHDKLEEVDGLTIHDIICLAGQLALEDNNHEVAIPAIESIIKHSPDNQQVITALRCLIRLKMSFFTGKPKRNDINTMLFYLKTALDKLTQTNNLPNGGQKNSAEYIWFMKIAWNLALESEGLHQEMHELFVLTDKFAKLCPQDKTTLVKQKSSLLMAASSSLQIAKDASDQDEKKKYFLQVLDHVNNCRNILDLLNKTLNQVSSLNPDDVPVLLCIYEFDAKANLNHDDIESLLEKISKLQNVKAKTFETIAGLATQLPCTPRHIQITKNALIMAIQKHCETKKECADYGDCSYRYTEDVRTCKSYRGLIELCLRNGSSSDAESKEEAWHYFQEAANVIEKSEKSTLPEIEIQWLMTKSWNSGVHLYSAGKYQAAEKWCGMGMRLMEQLSDLKHFYERKITELYSEVLSGIETGRAQLMVEE